MRICKKLKIKIVFNLHEDNNTKQRLAYSGRGNEDTYYYNQT